MSIFHRQAFTIESVRAHWNRVAAVYDGWNKAYDTTHFQRFVEAMKYVNLAPGLRVLDVWSRTGNASRYLFETCPEIQYTGFELSEGMIRLARQKYPQRSFAEGSLVALPFPGAYFDRVVSLETLEHVPAPVQFLQELRRVIKPGGRLVMSLPPAYAEWMTALVDGLKVNHGEGPHRFLPSREVKQLLSQCGFRLLIHRGTVLIPAGPAFLRQKGNQWLEEHVQGTFLAEMGIRQFYVCEASL
jgi:ubiquinone/menaquinone biosynthesis C-methylase UbiE